MPDPKTVVNPLAPDVAGLADAALGVVLNRFGYFEKAPMPDAETLARYYTEHYYQEDLGVYAHQYSEADERYRLQQLSLRWRAMQRVLGNDPFANKRFLDVGCGEGWAMAFFAQHGFEVTGLDFSAYGCRVHNPDLCAHVRVGGVQQELSTLANEGQCFDVIWIAQALEQMLEPAVILSWCRRLAHPKTVLVVECAHNFSPLQQDLYRRGLIDGPYWVEGSDHVSFFNPAGFRTLARSEGWLQRLCFSDYLIQLCLYHADTHYLRHPDTGKAAFAGQQALTDMLYRTDPDKALDWFVSAADLGLGRTFVSMCIPVDEEEHAPR
ncbi:MAG: methyltransferase domain-containing protein [Cyanobacteria bacterium HKST-UBA04]|nr:methyltransferase domain-containing protein [Cyanobacteria bacterium HKST-UBA04]